MKQFPLGGDWSLALHVRDDGQRVGAALNANVLHVDLLCLMCERRGFPIVLLRRVPPTPNDTREVRHLFAPAGSLLDSARQPVLEAMRSRELGVSTELVLMPFARGVPVRFITVPPGETR